MTSPIIVSPSGSSVPTGVTRRTYRRALADELGEFAALTVTGTPSEAVHPDADRQVLVTALASDGVPPVRFDGAYIYICDGAQAGEVRAVLSGTFDGPIGSLLLDRPFDNPLASGTEIEVTHPLPGKRHLTLRGLNELVDEALERIRIAVRLSLTGNGTYEFDLDAYPWIERYEDLRGIYDTVGDDFAPTLSPYGYRLVSNGVDRTLVLDKSYTSAETFRLDATVRADKYLYDGASWAFRTTPGLQDDDWQAAAPERWVLAFGCYRGFDLLRKLADRDERLEPMRSTYERKYAVWAQAAARIKTLEFPRPLQERTRPMVRAPYRQDWR